MQRLTVAGRLLITALILVGIFFAFRYFGGNEALRKLSPKDNQSAESQTLPQPDGQTTDGSADEATSTASSSSDNASSSDNVASDQPKQAFSYTSPEPQNGQLKGVVELGASGFNSFIVRVDDQKRWKLEKAEFGNSLVMENMASDNDIRAGLKSYIGKMLDFGVGGRNIHFVVSSGALKAEGTQKIIKALKSLNYVVNTVTPEQEGSLGLRAVLPI